jgi:hypothetical protein
MESLRTTNSAVYVTLLVALSCTGKIGDVGKGGTGLAGKGTVGTGTSGAGAGNSSTGNGARAPTGTGGGGATGAAGLGTGPVPAQPPTNPGTVVLRRLNADEYDNTVRDLLGTTLTPGTSFPADDLGAQFTTVGSALSLSPTYVQAYADAASVLIDDLFAAPAARQQAIITCDVTTGGDTCARTIVTALANKAFRRPATSTEIDALMTPVATAKTLTGATATDGLKAALAAVLVSPYFLFKPEIDPATPGPHALGQYELATRLSYALWASTPDAALLAAAAAGQLSTDAQVKAQVTRMLADPRASALLDEFAGAWLDFSNVESHDADPTVFPAFTPAVAHSMRLEARSFMRDFLSSTKPVADMFNAGFTYVDATLAKQYGLPTTPGALGPDGLWRADTTGSQRVGLLTLGSILTTTSEPTRTSPVKRGDFIYERLLCGTIGQPPNNVAALQPAPGTMTVRQTLEAHAMNPACSGCHSIMDPLGFGLENYDAIGSYRTVDGTLPVDATGTLPDGMMFTGARDLAAALAQDPRFVPCMTQSLMTYSIGRLMNQADDVNWANYVAHEALTANGSLGSLVNSVILSAAFRTRQAPM